MSSFALNLKVLASLCVPLVVVLLSLSGVGCEPERPEGNHSAIILIGQSPLVYERVTDTEVYQGTCKFTDTKSGEFIRTNMPCVIIQAAD